MTEDEICERFMRGVQLLEDADRDYMLDKIEDSRWLSGPGYNRGVHILMNMIQLAVEASYASPNMRVKK